MKAKTATPKTILFRELTDEALDRILRQDPDEKFTWYAKRHGIGYRVQRVEKNLEGLLDAQEGMEPGWMLVIYERDDTELPPIQTREDFLEFVVENDEYGAYLNQKDRTSAEDY